jgi:hypothetical protein
MIDSQASYNSSPASRVVQTDACVGQRIIFLKYTNIHYLRSFLIAANRGLKLGMTRHRVVLREGYYVNIESRIRW